MRKYNSFGSLTSPSKALRFADSSKYLLLSFNIPSDILNKGLSPKGFVLRALL